MPNSLSISFSNLLVCQKTLLAKPLCKLSLVNKSPLTCTILACSFTVTTINLIYSIYTIKCQCVFLMNNCFSYFSLLTLSRLLTFRLLTTAENIQSNNSPEHFLVTVVDGFASLNAVLTYHLTTNHQTINIRKKCMSLPS